MEKKEKRLRHVFVHGEETEKRGWEKRRMKRVTKKLSDDVNIEKERGRGKKQKDHYSKKRHVWRDGESFYPISKET